jgi:hypothetical protein
MCNIGNCKIFLSMNESSRCELVLARLPQRREEMAAPAVEIQGEQLEETMPRVQGLGVSPVEEVQGCSSLFILMRGGAQMV